MRRREWQTWVAVGCGALCARGAWGGVHVSYQIAGADGGRITEIAAGDTVILNVLLSTDAGDGDVLSFRTLQFDFRGTSENLGPMTFEWTLVEAGLTDEALYLTENELLQNVRASYIGLERVEGFILDLTEEPVKVGELTLTVLGDGALDAFSAAVANPENADEGGRFLAGFEESTLFTVAEGNLSQQDVTVAAGDIPEELLVPVVEPPPSENMNSNENENENDNASENMNDNSGGGMKAPCGIAMITPMLMCLIGLSFMKRHRARIIGVS